MDLILSLISCLIVYSIFDNSTDGGFKKVLGFRFVVEIISILITGTFEQISSYGIGYILLFLVIIIVLILLTTAIEYWAYSQTNGFITFLLSSAIIEIVVISLLSSVIANIFSIKLR